MASSRGGVRQRRDRGRRPKIRALLAAAGVASALLVIATGCSGVLDSYTQADIRRDALELVPPGARYVHLEVIKGDGFNPTMSASLVFTLRHGTPKQRIALYVRIALAHGWKINHYYNKDLQEHYTLIENGHAYLSFRTDYGLTDGTDRLFLVME